MKKYIFTLIAALLLSSAAFGVASNRVYYHVDIVDEFGDTITSPAITQVDVQNESGVAVAVYSTKSGTTEVGSTGVITSGLSDGRTEFWYADTAIDITVTDGTRTYEIESYSVRTTRFMLPSFLISTSGNALGQTDDLDFTFGSWILDGDTANRLDMIPDNDGAILGIGDGTTQADVYFYKSSTDWMFFDEGNGILEMVNIDIDLDDASLLTFGTGNDFEVYSDTANILEFDPAAAGNEIRFGTAYDDAVVMTWYSDTDGDTVVFDEENVMVEFEDVSIALGDGTNILFGDTIGTGDFSLSSTSAVLTLAQIVADTGTVVIGANGTDIPITWYAETAGADVILTGDTFLLDGVDMTFEDGDFLKFGDDSDWTFDSSTTKILDIVPLTTDETSAIYIGAASAGADLKIFGTDAGDYWEWDASADLQTIVGDAVAWTLTEAATTAVNIDITGTNGGFDLDTTDGPIALTAAGAANGDVTITVGDEFILSVTGGIAVSSAEEAADAIGLNASGTAGGITMIAGTAGIYCSGDILKGYVMEVESVTGNKSVGATESGEVFMVGVASGAAADIVLTLPTAAAGLIYHVVDPNETAAADVTITAGASDKIDDGSAAASIVHDTDADNMASVTLLAIDAEHWVTLTSTGTWAAE